MITGMTSGQVETCLQLMQENYWRVMQRCVPVQAIFDWGRAKGEWEPENVDGVLRHVARLYHMMGKPTVFLPGYVGSMMGQGDTGHVGPEILSSHLYSLGVNRICSVSGGGHNTKSEFDDFLRFFVGQPGSESHRIVLGVTMLSHAPRALLGAVRSMDTQTSRNLLLVPTWPEPVDFSRKVYGSQGAGPFSRREWVPQEFGRIPIYAEKGDMATWERAEQYLRWVGDELDTRYPSSTPTLMEILRPHLVE